MRSWALGDLEIPAFGIGEGGATGAYGAVDEDGSVAAIRHALDRGIQVVDTAGTS